MDTTESASPPPARSRVDRALQRRILEHLASVFPGTAGPNAVGLTATDPAWVYGYDAWTAPLPEYA